MNRKVVLNTFSTKSFAVIALSGSFVLGSAVLGCSSKNYVRSQTAPIVQNINELDTRTAEDHRAIGDTDARAQGGISRALSAADAANQHAVAAGTAADQANQSALGAATHVDSLASVIANLDQYKPLANISVNFAFDKALLTPEDKKQLDDFAATLNSVRGYILQVTGGTDAIGNPNYNYLLSERRADSVVNYLASRYNVPPHKFYLVGIGKDKQVANDRTAAGRAKNRRVEIQLLSNMTQTTPLSSSSSSSNSSAR